MRQHLVKLGREAGQACFGSFRKVMLTVLAGIVLAASFIPAFMAWLYGNVLTALTISILIWLTCALLGVRPKFGKVKRH